MTNNAPISRPNAAYFSKAVNGDGLSPREYLVGWRSLNIGGQPRTSENSVAAEAIVIRRGNPAGLRIAASIPSVYSILTQGSWASEDVIPFSDLDVVVVIDDEAHPPPAAIRAAVPPLRRLCRQLYHADPLMHHGLMFCDLSAFRCYDQMFLPVATLREAVVCYGEDTLAVSHSRAETTSAARRRVADVARSLAKDYDFAASAANDFSLKLYLSGTLLLPVLYLAARGQFVHKRDSFEAAYAGCREVDWEGVRLAETWRIAWKPTRIHPVHTFALQVLPGKSATLSKRLYRANFNAMAKDLPALKAAIERTCQSIIREVEC